MAYQYLLAKCPLNGGEYTASDWWYVLSRHFTFECAEDHLVKVSKAKKEIAKYQIFHLQGYKPGEQFNIKLIRKT